jgi:hypothetical protein
LPNFCVIVLLIDAILVLNKVKLSKYTISIKKVAFLAVAIASECIGSSLIAILSLYGDL